jgi:hypothetical protein
MASQTGVWQIKAQAISLRYTNRMGRCNVGVAAAHPFSWLLSSPQQPLETEDPPTVSLAPQYTSQRLCRAIEFFGRLKRPKNQRLLQMPTLKKSLL